MEGTFADHIAVSFIDVDVGAGAEYLEIRKVGAFAAFAAMAALEGAGAVADVLDGGVDLV